MPQPRKSREEHKLTGTREQYVLPDGEVSAGRPKVPKSLSPDARKTFKRLARMLKARRHLTAGDSEIISLYCIAADRHARAVKHLADEGEIVTRQRATKSGELYDVDEENKWLSIAQNSEKYMRGLLSDLGLNPMQRNRVKTIEKPKTDDELPSVAETVLPEPEINLDDPALTAAMENMQQTPAQTISPETQALLDEADAMILEEEKNGGQ